MYYILWVCACGLSYPACNAYAPFVTVTCPALQYFSALSHKQNDFREKKVTVHKMCVLVFSTTFLTNISHSKNRARYDHKCTVLYEMIVGV